MRNSSSIQCPLCGFRFEQTASSACKTCPLNRNACQLICCPNCGYQWAENSQLVNRLKKWFRKKEVAVEEEN